MYTTDVLRVYVNNSIKTFSLAFDSSDWNFNTSFVFVIHTLFHVLSRAIYILCLEFMSISNQTVHSHYVFCTRHRTESLSSFATINNVSSFSSLISSSSCSQYFDRKVKQPRANKLRVWIQATFLFSRITQTIAIIIFWKHKYLTKNKKLTCIYLKTI